MRNINKQEARFECVTAAALPIDVRERQMNLAWQLRILNGDCRSLSGNCEIACAPVGDIPCKNEFEVRMRVVYLEPAR